MHSTILGDPEEPEFYPEPICRGAWTILVNGFVRGGSCATSDLVKAMIQWLNSNGEFTKKIQTACIRCARTFKDRHNCTTLDDLDIKKPRCSWQFNNWSFQRYLRMQMLKK